MEMGTIQAKGVLQMTEREARQLIDGLTEEQKIILYHWLACQLQNPAPSESETETIS